MKEETRRESVAMLKRLVYIGLTKRNTVSTSFLFTKIARLFLAIFTKPRFFMRILFDFKGAHEIASLSCYFLILQKVEEKKSSEANY